MTSNLPERKHFPGGDVAARRGFVLFDSGVMHKRSAQSVHQHETPKSKNQRDKFSRDEDPEQAVIGPTLAMRVIVVAWVLRWMILILVVLVLVKEN